jgi:hypothetical protein
VGSIYLGDENEPLVIKNQNSSPKIVILFPVSRVGLSYEAKWKKVIDLASNSDAGALVIIDKTPSQEAKDYFVTNSLALNFDLYVSPSNLTKSTFQSQSVVKLEDKLWIVQLHDDDMWSEKLTLPPDAKNLDAFLTRIRVSSAPNKSHQISENYPPTSLFSLIPSPIWNRFTEYIVQQKGNAAGSLDSMLTMVVNLTCNKVTIQDFIYYYDDSHWSNRKIATRHLRNLTKIDGWEELACPEIAMINRTIDELSAISFYRGMLSSTQIQDERKRLYGTFSPPLKKRMIVLFRKQIFGKLLFFRFVTSFLKSKYFNEKFHELTRIHEIDLILVKTWGIKNQQGLLEFIKDLKRSKRYPKLEGRFQFWVENVI